MLRCTVLSVGHGCAVLVELPNGETLLYDAGSLGDSRRASRAASGALWHFGHDHVDAIVLSHADVDHFNGVPELLTLVPARSAFASRQILDMRQPAIVDLVEAIDARDVSLRLIGTGDHIRLDNSVGIEILHPHPAFVDADDNANSIALAITYAGRRILLPGDLEGAGLDAVLRTPKAPVEFLLSPHHGSEGANPPALARWSTPRWVVASAGRGRSVDALRRVYGDLATVYSTAEAGAVTLEIDASGNASVIVR